MAVASTIPAAAKDNSSSLPPVSPVWQAARPEAGWRRNRRLIPGVARRRGNAGPFARRPRTALTAAALPTDKKFAESLGGPYARFPLLSRPPYAGRATLAVL